MVLNVIHAMLPAKLVQDPPIMTVLRAVTDSIIMGIALVKILALFHSLQAPLSMPIMNILAKNLAQIPNSIGVPTKPALINAIFLSNKLLTKMVSHFATILALMSIITSMIMALAFSLVLLLF